MKKKNIINLIRYHAEGDEAGFRTEAYNIAKYFDESGDYQLSEYVMSLMSNANTFLPQINDIESCFLEKVIIENQPLPLPDSIQQDIIGLINAVSYRAGINKFLFHGAPGTGKTETVKQIARILERELFMVNFSAIIDSKLGQTQKNIASLFKEINNFKIPDKVLILFDEIDAIALDRASNNDLREMGRATTSILKGLDHLDERILLIATTNLYKHFDKALTRRFDSIIDFNRYTKNDLVEVGVTIINDLVTKFKFIGKNIKLCKKIFGLMHPVMSPGELKNYIRTSVAFSNPGDEHDYLKRLYKAVIGNEIDLKNLQVQGFTVREIELLTGVSKSQVSRELNND